MEKVWTPEQETAIDRHGRSILVSAAAGSGKTAVLIERIIRMILDEEHPVSIDRILVVTFTRAAATQMRDRLRERVLEKLKEDPDNEHLKDQLVLISCADITTIDSFCKKVVSEHYQRIPGLDPGFRLADGNEIRLLEEEVLGDLLREEYEKASPDFLELVFRYNNVKVSEDQSVLSQMIRKLSLAADNTPRPDRWLEELAREKKPFQALCRTVLKVYFEQLLSTLTELTEEYNFLIRYAENAGLSEKLLAGLGEELDHIRYGKKQTEEILPAVWEYRPESEEKLSERVRTLIPALVKYSFPPFRGKEQDRNLPEWDNIVSTRNDLKTAYYQAVKPGDAVGNDLLDLDYLTEEYLRQEPILKTLILLTIEYRKRIRKKKDRKNLYGFSDIAHFALDILTDVRVIDDGKEEVVPSTAAESYRRQYEEIMIDEYQDSNLIQELLLMAVSGESIGDPNVFMVGDVKQSIYRFRNADPGIFIGKYYSYESGESLHQKIELRANFRSHPDVLLAVNYVFYRLMRREVGGVDYTPESELKPGRVISETPEPGPVRTEFLIMDPEKEEPADTEDSEETEEDQADLELETRMIAEKILAVTDPKNGYRIEKEGQKNAPVGYGDILILMRSIKGRAEIVSRILMQYGIPSVSESSRSFLTSYEISLLMDALRIVDNPRQDIPLADVMLSPMFSFTAEDLARIRLLSPKKEGKKTFYDRLVGFVSEQSLRSKEEALCRKTEEFLETLSRYRTLSTFLSIHDLLSGMIRERSLDAFFASMPGGEYRMRNVRILLDQTLSFEGTSYLGLFSFIRYVEMVEEKDLSFADITMATGEGDAVRIMSIHKSKGLECPVVFVADLDSNFRPESDTLITEREYGAFLRDEDRKNHTKYPGYARRIFENLENREIWGEEIRLLYVAMTRAKEYLFLTAAKKDLSGWLLKHHLSLMPRNPLSVNRIMECKNCMDWLLEAGISRGKLIRAALKAYPDLPVPALPEEEEETLSMDLLIVKRSRLTISQKELRMRQENEASERTGTGFSDVEELRADPEYSATFERIRKYYDHTYPYEAERAQRANLSVSFLKHEAIRRFREEAGDGEEEEYIFETEREEAKLPVPAFLNGNKREDPPSAKAEHVEKEEREEKEEKEKKRKKAYLSASGAERGTAYHHVLERLDLSLCKTEKELRVELERLVSEGLLTKREVDLVQIRSLLKFLKSPLGQRMAAAQARGMLFKEQPFFLGLTMEEYLHDISLRAGEYWGEDLLKISEDQNYIMVQGEIDGFFLEEDRVILMDYKTDRVSLTDGEQILKDRYEAQLFYYSLALSRILDHPVEECWIYSFSLGRAFRVDRGNGEDGQ